MTDHRAEAESWLAVAHRISKGSYPSEAKGPALIAIAHALLAGPPQIEVIQSGPTMSRGDLQALLQQDQQPDQTRS